MKKKKIAHIITRLTLGGAQENTMFSYFNHDRKRYNIYLITGLDDSFGGNDYIERLSCEKNVHFIDNMLNPINLIKDVKALIDIYKFLRVNDIDIVHTHSSKAGVLGRIAGKLAGVPVIVHTVHGWSFHDRMGKIKKNVYINIERFANKFCDKLITVTNLDIEKGLKARIGKKNKYVTIRSAIDFIKFQNYDKNKVADLKNKYKGKKIIGTIGRLSEQKNVFDFIRIGKNLINKRKDIHFIIIGDGPLRKQIEDYIDETRMSEYITLLGIRTDVHDLIHGFDVFLLTSLWEGLPRVIPEAMCCKVPAVANCVDGVAEIINDGVNGFCIKPHDLEGSCEKIMKLLNDNVLKEKIINNAMLTIYPEYEALYMVKQIESLYEKVWNEKS